MQSQPKFVGHLGQPNIDIWHLVQSNPSRCHLSPLCHMDSIGLSQTSHMLTHFATHILSVRPVETKFHGQRRLRNQTAGLCTSCVLKVAERMRAALSFVWRQSWHDYSKNV